MNELPKSRTIGQFELLDKIGEGGMGAVYRARQATLDRVVALKLLPPGLAADREFLARFQREAQATAKLNHPNIVAGISVGFAGGVHYFAMEYIEGENLAQRIEREGRLPENDLAAIGARIASALAHAHQAGILHRDVKPENIILMPDGTPKLADLGLAKGGTRDNTALTQTNMSVGSPHYISPEQAGGERDLDGRTDVYSLGATLYHAATGRTPFEGTTAAVLMAKHLSEKIPHPRDWTPELSERFCTLLGRMLARDRTYRYACAADAQADLEALAAGRPIRARPLSETHSNFLPRAKPRAERGAQRASEPSPRGVRSREGGGSGGSGERARGPSAVGRFLQSPLLIVLLLGGAGLLLGVAIALAMKSKNRRKKSKRQPSPAAVRQKRTAPSR